MLGKLHLPHFASFLCSLLLVTVRRVQLNLKITICFKSSKVISDAPFSLGLGICEVTSIHLQAQKKGSSLLSGLCRGAMHTPLQLAPWGSKESLLWGAGCVNAWVDDMLSAFLAALCLS